MDDHLTSLRSLFNRLPNFIRSMQGAVGEMSASAGPADYFTETKDALAVQLNEL